MLSRLSGRAKIKELLSHKCFNGGRNSAKVLATLAAAAGYGSLQLLARLLSELAFI